MNFRQSQAVFTKKIKKIYLYNFSTCFQPSNAPFQASFQQIQQFHVEKNFSIFACISIFPIQKRKNSQN